MGLDAIDFVYRRLGLFGPLVVYLCLYLSGVVVSKFSLKVLILAFFVGLSSSLSAENLINDPNFSNNGGKMDMWVKSKSGPKWGNTYKIPSDVLSANGSTLSVDFRNAPQDMVMGVLKLDTKQLQHGYDYELIFEIKGSKPSSIIVNLPEKDSAKNKSRGEWFHVHKGFKEVRAEFNYNKDINKGQVQLFFQPKNKQDHFLIQKLRLVEVKN